MELPKLPREIFVKIMYGPMLDKTDEYLSDLKKERIDTKHLLEISEKLSELLHGNNQLLTGSLRAWKCKKPQNYCCHCDECVVSLELLSLE
jgi:hypothetical protein